MLRKKSKAVPEGNGLIPQDAYVMLGGITIEELRRVMSKAVGKALKKLTESMRRANQRSASLEQDARQPRLATEADVKADKKTRERTKGAAAAVQAKHGDSCSAKRVYAGSTSSTSFGMKVEPPALPRLDDVLVDKGAAAQSHVSHPWGCAHHQPLMAYFPPAKPLQRQRPSFTNCLFGSAR